MRRKFLKIGGLTAAVFLITLGIFASNGWLPSTDPFSGKKTGWFARELPENTASAWNPFPPPLPTPQLSKEYIYAGSRLLAVEDANATAAPPADIAVWRPGNGNWMVMGQTGSQSVTFGFGGGWLGDIPVVGDYEGDGKTDFTVFRPDSTAFFYVWPSNGASWWGYSWGTTGDIPVSGDFDGDGKTDYAVVRQDAGAGTSTFYVVPSGGGGWWGYSYGTNTDLPAVADYDGDGRADVGVFRASNQTFYWTYAAGGTGGVTIGQSGEVVTSDYDGDGRADQAVFNAANAEWTIHYSTTGGVATVTWGSAGSSGCTGGSCSGIRPVHNDYDGDGKTDLAVWDNATSATWTILKSSDGSTRTESFGTTGDIPVPAFYRR